MYEMPPLDPRQSQLWQTIQQSNQYLQDGGKIQGPPIPQDKGFWDYVTDGVVAITSVAMYPKEAVANGVQEVKDQVKDTMSGALSGIAGIGLVLVIVLLIFKR